MCLIFGISVKLYIKSQHVLSSTIINQATWLNSDLTKKNCIQSTMIMKVDTVKLNNRKLYDKMFFREFDVLHHIKPNDFWVILNRRVLDLSHLVKLIDELPSINNDLTALHQLCMFGGTDVSKLFSDRKANQLEMFDLKSNTEYGLLHGCYWWNDPVLIVGSITARERHICVRNKSKGTQRHLTVCEEDSIYAIRAKFCAVYSENENMIWRKRGESTCCPNGYLSLDRTLTENGLKWTATDEITYLWMFRRDEFRACNQIAQTVDATKNSQTEIY